MVLLEIGKSSMVSTRLGASKNKFFDKMMFGFFAQSGSGKY
jgi:hypothetical protein